MKSFLHENSYITLRDDGNVMIGTEESVFNAPSSHINTRLSLFANPEAELEAARAMNTDDFFLFKGFKTAQNHIFADFGISSCGLRLREDFELIKGCNVIRQINQLENAGQDDVVVTECSSCAIGFIGLGENAAWAKKGRLRVHYAISRWQGEAQWRTASLEELGVYPCSTHKWDKTEWAIRSQSSWSTGSYLPLVIIEDTEKNESWFAEVEGAMPWQIKITSLRGSSGDFVSLSAGSVDETGGWKLTLKSGEKYSTVPAVFGVVKGGFNEAVNALIDYKRKNRAYPNVNAPIVFNDFMNCAWGMQTEETTKALIDKAAEVGAECFCIDDGWAYNGLWTTKDEKFGKGGVKGIIDYIRSKNMLAGLWFELESTSDEAAEKLGTEDWYMTRNGVAFPHYHPKLNMRNEKARKFLEDTVAYYYDLGVRYIKNDYNTPSGYGTDGYGDSPAEGVRKNTEAFYDLIKRIRARCPKLIIENCGSGAMRSDGGTLKLFDLQSTSDQEDYKLYPSIAIGSYAFIPPERAGVWAYPYPLRHANIKDGWVDVESFVDGMQTVFNMVTGMSGLLYLSGRIDLADEYNTALIKEGVEQYKQMRAFIVNSYPLFLEPMKGMREDTYYIYGLTDKEKTKAYVYVWFEKQTEVCVRFPMFTSCKIVYPSDCKYAEIAFSNDVLRICSDRKYSAVIVELEE